MIYLPFENVNDYACYYFYNSETIRAYKTMPTQGATVQYDDYYINSHYLYQNGSQTFGNYSNIPTCLSTSRLTNVYSYRNDFADIMLIVFVFVFIFGFLIHKFIKQLFKRWR